MKSSDFLFRCHQYPLNHPHVQGGSQSPCTCWHADDKYSLCTKEKRQLLRAAVPLNRKEREGVSRKGSQGAGISELWALRDSKTFPADLCINHMAMACIVRRRTHRCISRLHTGHINASQASLCPGHLGVLLSGRFWFRGSLVGPVMWCLESFRCYCFGPWTILELAGL